MPRDDEKRGDMRNDLQDRAAKNRARQNKELCEKVRRGEIIESTGTLMDSWFPPRGKIKKDKKAIAELYGEDEEENPRKRNHLRQI